MNTQFRQSFDEDLSRIHHPGLFPPFAMAVPSSPERGSPCRPSSSSLVLGDEIADVLEEYPLLTREDVLACLRYSSHLMGNHFTLQKVA